MNLVAQQIILFKRSEEAKDIVWTKNVVKEVIKGNNQFIKVSLYKRIETKWQRQKT